MKPNETLQLHVVQQLEWDPSVDASNIGVQVHDGVVTLEGNVSSYAEKFAAVRGTKAVSGVKGLADELQVKLHPAVERTDTDLATFALQMLAWDTVVPKDQVQVMVRQGWMMLEGEVDWDYQRIGAERAVQYLSGIKGVTNAITLKHRDLPTDVKAIDLCISLRRYECRGIVPVRSFGSTSTSEEQKASPTLAEISKIESALQRSAASDAQHIAVEMHGGTATLRGEVHTFAARDEAVLAAWGAPGVLTVTNYITVSTDFGVR